MSNITIQKNLKYLSIELMESLTKYKQGICRPCCNANNLNHIIDALRFTVDYTSAHKTIEKYESLKKDCSKCRDYNKINDVMNELKQAVNYKEPVKRYR